MLIVLGRVSIAAMKQVGEERVYPAYTSALLFITEKSEDRFLEAGADAEDMERYCYLLASLLSYREPRTTCPGHALPWIGPSLIDH